MKAYKKLLSSTLTCNELGGYDLIKVTDANACIEMASYEVAASIIDDVIFEIRKGRKRFSEKEQKYLKSLRDKQRFYKNKLNKIS